MSAAASKPLAESSSAVMVSSESRPLFEACKNGDIDTVNALATIHNVNLRDTSGRKSTPLHFAAGAVEYSLGGVLCDCVCVCVCLQDLAEGRL